MGKLEDLTNEIAQHIGAVGMKAQELDKARRQATEDVAALDAAKKEYDVLRDKIDAAQKELAELNEKKAAVDKSMKALKAALG